MPRVLRCLVPIPIAPHVVRNGTLKGRQRYHCNGCGAWFGETHNTPMYRLRTSPEDVGRALLVVMRRGSLRAAEAIQKAHTRSRGQPVSWCSDGWRAYPKAITRAYRRPLRTGRRGRPPLRVPEGLSLTQTIKH
jgi:hypothetical protein